MHLLKNNNRYMKKILNDIINIVKSDVEAAANLDDHNYEELTKKEIVDYINELYSGISKYSWLVTPMQEETISPPALYLK